MQAPGSLPTLTSGRLATIVASRLVLNAIFRLTYPLIPFAAASFGASTGAVTWLVTIQVLAGLASPLGGWLGDRFGYRDTMSLGLAVVCCGAIGAALAPGLGTTVAALGIAGLGMAIYQPAMQAYVSVLTPLARRGRALGVVEFAWSLAGILAVPPLVGLAERTRSLQAPFGVLAVCTFAARLLGHRVLPAERHRTRRPEDQRESLRPLLAQPMFWSLLLFLWLALSGVETIFIVQAPWLAANFGASPQQIGNTLVAFGIGELIGVSLATAFTDRIGKVRAPLIGYTTAALIYVLLPLLGRDWPSYILLFMLLAIAFEFAIVASFALTSALDPARRGVVMAGAALTMTTGRAGGSRIGSWLYESTNILVNGLVAAVLTLIGVLIASRVRPQERDHDTKEAEVVTIL